jgi:ribosomal protein S18 acetylase RimI-like enzyme
VIEVGIAREASDELVAAFRRLLPQLSSSAPPSDPAAVGTVVGAPSNTVLVARDGGDIVGILTLVMFPIPTGLRARIEDVVVDSRVRGRGVGAALTQEALRLAAERGAKSVDLTSNPSRVAANQLYKRLGFEMRETNSYRYVIRGQTPN